MNTFKSSKAKCSLSVPLALFAALILSLVGFGSANAQEVGVMEAYPDDVQARLEARARKNLRMARETDGVVVDLVLEILNRWDKPVVTVAFLGGNPALHGQIADVVKGTGSWINYGNIKFDFGFDSATGNYRTWSRADVTYSSDIRISFNAKGYWSAVGKDSIDIEIFGAGDATMNFGGFDNALPSTWKGTVLHEFGHALGFQHEHQSARGGCDSEFQWDDLPDGTPGIYTLLGGHPNYWPKWKVDHNLRELPNSDAYIATRHDPSSIMHYSFSEWMFKRGKDSQCYTGKNEVLSELDTEGMDRYYPTAGTGEFNSPVSGIPKSILEKIANADTTPEGLRSRIQDILQ